jgi:hypothetical protein
LALLIAEGVIVSRLASRIEQIKEMRRAMRI